MNSIMGKHNFWNNGMGVANSWMDMTVKRVRKLEDQPTEIS